MHTEAKLYLVTLVKVILHSYKKVPFSKRSLSLSLCVPSAAQTFFKSLV